MAYNSDHFDLTQWKITLPEDSKGGLSGTAREVRNLVGYEDPRYFFDSPDGSMTFRAMTDGATTSGSHYPRTELRELDSKGGNASWDLKEGGTMTATLKVDELPTRTDGSEGRLIVGQIHGNGNELVRLYYDAGKLYFANDLSGSNNKENHFQFFNDKGEQPQVGLGEKFSYMIDAHGSTLTVKILADGQVYTSQTAINSIWQSDHALYFKAGAYLQINESSGYGHGETSFDALDFSHIAGGGMGGWNKPLPNHGGTGGDTTGGGVDTTHGGGDTMGGGVDTTHGGGDTTGGGVDTTHGGGDTTGGGVDTTHGGGDTTGGGVDTHGLVIHGDNNNNVILGAAGADSLNGNNGDDKISGGDGNDNLAGNNGDDTLIGGHGADILKGGDGKDTFVFQDIQDAGDTILDFRHGEKVDVSGIVAHNLVNVVDHSVAGLLHAGYLSITQDSPTQNSVYVDVDGAAGSQHATLLATVDIVAGHPVEASSLIV